MIPLEFDASETLTWKLLFYRVVEGLDAAPSAPEVEGATALDQIARCAFGWVNAAMIRAGEVPCEQPEEAAAVLAEKYIQAPSGDHTALVHCAGKGPTRLPGELPSKGINRHGNQSAKPISTRSTDLRSGDRDARCTMPYLSSGK